MPLVTSSHHERQAAMLRNLANKALGRGLACWKTATQPGGDQHPKDEVAFAAILSFLDASATLQDLAQQHDTLATRPMRRQGR